MVPTAKIVISGIKAYAFHGCTPEEKEKGQDFIVDIELEYDAARAVENDDLAEAVDYDALATDVYELVTRERYDLVETLAARIGERIMDTTPASRLLVRVRKPQAPLSQEVGEVAVEVVLASDGW
ncbi:MAG: dihydroneopterin aldolase [Actinomycetota bacterium]